MVAIALIFAMAVPTTATAQSTTDTYAMSLTDKRFHRRVVESVLWGMLIVSV